MIKKVLLRDLCLPDECGKYGIPAAAEEFSPLKKRYLRITDISDDGELLDQDKKSVMSSDISKYLLKEGDIVFARTGNSTGRTYYHEKQNGELAYAGFLIKYSLDPLKVNPKYLKFYTTSDEYRQWVKNLSVGSTRGNINAQTFANCPITLPERSQQDDLVVVLSSLVDKIALNNRINAELEAMAKTIYDYWFVQFDFPISKEQAKAMGKPKLEGKPYKASGGKMVWSEEIKREVPEGWSAGTLTEIANITMGQSPPGETYNEEGEGTVFFQGSTDFGLRFPSIRQFTTQPGRMAKRGDILLSVRAPVGTMNISMVDCCIGRGLAALSSKDDCMAYLHGVLTNLQQIFERRNTDGTTFGAITKDDLFSLRVVRAPKEILRKFDAITKPMFDKQNVMAEENQKLSELRDWLLPMLMNGQVAIRETTQSKVIKPTVSISKPANSYFYQSQLVAAIVNASRKHKITHGEMTLAKYIYLVDKLYGVPTYFIYERLHLGPYPKEMKKIVNNKKIFKIQNNEVSVVPQDKQYNYQFQKQVEEAVAELASIFNRYKGQERSHQTELLATVCKVVEDIKSTDLKAVRESMKNWPIDLKTSKFKNKAEKFSESETNVVLSLIVSKQWDKLLCS